MHPTPTRRLPSSRKGAARRVTPCVRRYRVGRGVDMRKRKVAVLRIFVLAPVSILCLLLVGSEYAHYRNYGHLVYYGLHVDPLSREAYIGIPGQIRMYRARLSNYTLLPVNLPACDYVTDAFGRGTEFPYAVQRWDAPSNSWQTIVDMSGEGYCRPAPLSMIETRLVSRRLSLGESVDAMEGEATGAREPFRKGELARFVIFTRMDKTGDWRSAVASAPFYIEDDVVRDENDSFRVRH